MRRDLYDLGWGAALALTGLAVAGYAWASYDMGSLRRMGPGLFPVTLGLMLWNGQTQRAPLYYELVVTGAAVSAVLLIVVMATLQRFWRAGLTAGATKG